MWRIPFAWYAVRWHVKAAWLRVATRVWLNRAWMRNGNCLVEDLVKIEFHLTRKGGFVALEPPYNQQVQEALDAAEDEDDE